MKEKSVKLKLSGDQALVLFDWIGRFNEAKMGLFEDQAEQRTLWDIEAMLEREIGIAFPRRLPRESTRGARPRPGFDLGCPQRVA